MALRFHAAQVDGGRRYVRRIVQVRPPAHREPSPQHGAITRCGRDRQNQRVGLQGANPRGIKPLVEDPERRKKPPRRDRQVRIGNVVDLEVVQVLVHRAAERPTAGRTLKLSLELSPAFDHPAVPERKKQNRINLRVEQRLPGGHARQIAGSPAQDGNRLVFTGSLRAPAGSKERQKQ